MKNIPNVIAVVVTYNDSDFCRRAVDCLIRQTHALYKIVIVDNNSDEDNKSNIASIQSDLVDVLWLRENTGGAGGFQRGCEYVSEKYPYDWIWMMDADAYPDPTCLESLLKYDSSGVGCLCPVIFGENLNEWQLYHHKKETKFLFRDHLAYEKYDDIPDVSKIDANAFVGPLICRPAIEKIGFPDGGLFIYGDDLEYTYRISRKFDVLLIKHAVIRHRDQPIHGVQNPKNWWKDYYEIRNRFIFIDTYSSSVFYRFFGKLLLRVRVMKRQINNFFSRRNHKLKRYRRKLLTKAYNDGRRGIKGKTIDPKECADFTTFYSK